MKQLRVLALAPSLLLAGLLVSACSSAPSRPPAPITTGDPRVDPKPTRPDGSGQEIAEPQTEIDDTDGEDMLAGNAVTPPHMAGRDITRAAVLLPFSHPNRRVRAEAQGMLAGIEMALFERAGDSFLIIPKDTEGTTSGAQTAFEEAALDGADVILGPLFSQNVRTVAPLADAAELPVIAFSNDPAAAGSGAYLAAFTVEEEVSRVVTHAISQGVDTFVFFGPRSDYGQRVERALRFETVRSGGQVIASQFYDANNPAPVDEARSLARVLEPLTGEDAPPLRARIGVMIPEAGVKLRAVAPLLPFSGVDFRKLRMLGTSQWNDPTLWREPTLAGGWFAITPPGDAQTFQSSFSRIYGRAPTDLASLGYDAAGVAIGLSRLDALNDTGLTDSQGFLGVNGLFRFRLDGTPERALSVMEIKPNGTSELIAPPVQSFQPSIG